MKRIGLISDTHGYLDPTLFDHFSSCDEIWHAGDVGSIYWLDSLKEGLTKKGLIPVIRGVYGNIDGRDIRAVFPETLVFTCEQLTVMMQHIGGYPGKYAPGVKDRIRLERPKIFISGHSHILKVMYDESLQCLHMNPGAAGKQGWQKVRTIIRFVIDGADIRDCEVVELPI